MICASPECNNEFTSGRSYQRFCSDKCRKRESRKRYKAKNPEKIREKAREYDRRRRAKLIKEVECALPGCGNVFHKLNGRKYCSEKCRRKDERIRYAGKYGYYTPAKTKTKQCAFVTCGKTFQTTRKNQIFCSEKCRRKDERNRYLEKYGRAYYYAYKPLKQKVLITCLLPSCGKEFEGYTYRKYCSNKCCAKHHKKMENEKLKNDPKYRERALKKAHEKRPKKPVVERVCAYIKCDNTFKTSHPRFKHKYCSRECYERQKDYNKRTGSKRALTLKRSHRKHFLGTQKDSVHAQMLDLLYDLKQEVKDAKKELS